MRQMKDSGVAWIGEIPEDWSIVKTKQCFDLYSGATPKTDNPSYWDGGIPWITPADYKTEDKYISFGRRNLSDSGVRSCGTTITPPNSIIFSKRAPIGLVVLSANNLCTNQGCIACVPKNVSSLFYYYAMSVFTESYELYGSGTTFKEISATNFANFILPLPSLNEQSRIATFLDQKCAEIDSLISLQEEMISELQAFKQSVITEAVTKGLDKNVKMKDSGVEWIGEIPENWNLLPIRALFTKRNQKNNPILSTERLSLSIGVGITKYADKTTNLDRFKDDFTAYQLAYPEDIVLNSMNMIVGAVGKSAYMGCVSPVYYVITAKEFVDPNFYGYLLNCARIREAYHSLGRGIYAIERGEGRVNTCRLKVPYYNFSIIKVPVPSYEEQVKIASYIKEKMEQIDSLIALKQQKITELKDYKKSIIYECVTGKKEVV